MILLYHGLKFIQMPSAIPLSAALQRDLRSLYSLRESALRVLVFLMLHLCRGPESAFRPSVGPRNAPLYVRCYGASWRRLFLMMCRGPESDWRRKDFQSFALPLSYLGVYVLGTSWGFNVNNVLIFSPETCPAHERSECCGVYHWATLAIKIPLA